MEFKTQYHARALRKRVGEPYIMTLLYGHNPKNPRFRCRPSILKPYELTSCHLHTRPIMTFCRNAVLHCRTQLRHDVTPLLWHHSFTMMSLLYYDAMKNVTSRSDLALKLKSEPLTATRPVTLSPSYSGAPSLRYLFLIIFKICFNLYNRYNYRYNSVFYSRSHDNS